MRKRPSLPIMNIGICTGITIHSLDPTNHLHPVIHCSSNSPTKLPDLSRVRLPKLLVSLLITTAQLAIGKTINISPYLRLLHQPITPYRL